jgi:hypothetical protein
MDGTREIVDAGVVGAALAVLSGLALVVGATLVAVARSRGAAAAKKAGLLSLGAALLYPAWRVYNAIEDWLGLDSVAGLLANLVLFALLGLALGIGLRRLWPEGARDNAAEMR